MKTAAADTRELGAGRDDPIDELEARIERAGRSARVSVPEEPVEGEGPLEQLRARLRAAHPERALREAAGGGPLAELLARVRAAKRLPSLEGETSSEVEADDPRERIHRRIEREIEAVGRRSAVDRPLRETAIDGDSGEASLEELVGRQVLEAVADRPLPADARIGALRRAARLARETDREEARELIRVLVGLEA